VNRIARRSALADLKLIPSAIRHVGTDLWPGLLRKFYEVLAARMDIRTETAVSRIIVHEGRATGIETNSGETIEAEHVILAPGREGADWLLEEARRLELEAIVNPVDVGVRVEIAAPILEELANAIYEPKLIFYSRAFDDRVRTFCVCPRGEVVMEYNDGVTTVNGHSFSDSRTANTNFAVLVSQTFTEPFDDPITYGEEIAHLANLLSDGVIVQRLGDLKAGRRSTPARMEQSIVTPTMKGAVPGDLAFVLPYRHLADILEFLEALDKLAPGVNGPATLLYGVEVKFYSSRVAVDAQLQTAIAGLYAIGDGAGITRGLLQSSASGVVAARAVLGR
jgi:uncharacterized FAD-dependent dehydrogenase